MKKILLIVCLLFFCINIVLAEEVEYKYVFDAWQNSGREYIDANAKEIRKGYWRLAWVTDSEKQRLEYDIIRGEIELHNGNLELAEIYLKKALEKYNKAQSFYDKGDNGYLLYNELAKLYLATGNFKRAIEYSNAALNAYSLQKEFIETRIAILNKIGGKNTVAQSYIFKETIFSDDLETWQKILNKIEQADENIKKNEKLTFGEVLAFTEKQRKSYSNKKKVYAKSYKIKAMFEYATGHFGAARGYINTALKLSDEAADMWWWSAMIEAEGFKDYKKAAELLTKALELEPRNDDFYRIRSYMYFLNKRYQDAFDDIDKLIAITPHDYLGYEIKGMYLHDRGELDEAIKMYDKALSLNPKAKDALENKQIIIKYKEAVRKAERQQSQKKTRAQTNDHQKRDNESWLYYLKRTGQL